MARLSGIVVEKWSGLPISGALVNINGTVVVADASGSFSIETPYQIVNVQVMHIGYTTLSERLNLFGNNNEIEFNLVPNVRSL